MTDKTESVKGSILGTCANNGNEKKVSKLIGKSAVAYPFLLSCWGKAMGRLESGAPARNAILTMSILSLYLDIYFKYKNITNAMHIHIKDVRWSLT